MTRPLTGPGCIAQPSQTAGSCAGRTSVGAHEAPAIPAARELRGNGRKARCLRRYYS